MKPITLEENELVTQVTEIAAQEGQSAADFVADAVRRHVAAYYQKRIQIETAAWYALPAAERATYEGKFVAVQDGRVIDSDEDRVTLFQRLRQQYGKEPIPIIPGGADPMPTYRTTSVRHA